MLHGSDDAKITKGECAARVPRLQDTGTIKAHASTVTAMEGLIYLTASRAILAKGGQVDNCASRGQTLRSKSRVSVSNERGTAIRQR